MLMATDVRQLALELSGPDFDRRYPHLWLMRLLDEDELPPASPRSSFFNTRPSDGNGRDDTPLLPYLGRESGSFGLHPLVKRTSLWRERILVGRALNNDIVLRHPSVSKLHAFFQRGDHGWTLRDTRSANGTFLDGMRLTEDGAPARPRAILYFGRQRLDLVSSLDLYTAFRDARR